MESRAGAHAAAAAEYSPAVLGEESAARGRAGGVAPAGAGGEAEGGSLQGDGGVLFQAAGGPLQHGDRFAAPGTHEGKCQQLAHQPWHREAEFGG